MVEKPTFIPSRLKNCAIGGHVAGTSDIIDDEKGKTQDVINTETDESIGSINTAIGDDNIEGTIKGRLKEVEDIIGTGGAIDERIADAVNALDSEQSGISDDTKVSVKVTEVDGKLTKVAVTTNDIASASDVSDINKKIVSEASESNKLIDKKYVDDALAEEEERAKAAEAANATSVSDEVTRAKGAEEANANAIAAINEKIPSDATKTNKLADKDFVNSSISTATATFKGTYNTLEELQAVTADNNDYGFVVSQDAAGNTVYNRYKFDGTQWSFEYALNNSSFTSEQWSSINSGINSEEVSRLSGVATGAQVNVIEIIKVNNSALTPTNKVVDISVPTQLSQLNEDSTHRLVTDIEKTKWNKKQDALTLDGDYDSTTNKVATQSTVKDAIEALDVNDISGFGKGKTLTTLKQTDGKVSATFQDISITKSQVSDFPQLGTAAGKDVPFSGDASAAQVVMGNDTRLSDSRTPKEHVHGNIKNGGTLQDTDVTVANGDKLVITDSSDSLKIARSSISFDGTTATKALTQKGTWETFGTSNLKIGTEEGDAFDGPTGNSHVTDETIHVKQEDKDKWDAKADAAGLTITPGTGANADKTTIQLKEGTSATVLTQHQSLGGLQPKLTFDDVPTENSNNPVKSGGVYSAVSSKYTFPSGGIPQNDLSQAVKNSLGKADSAVQSSDLEGYQTALISGTNIKTINNNSILGSGNLAINTTGVSWDNDPMMDGAAEAGTSEAYARGDHRHPSDTAKANVSEMQITDGTGDNSDKITIQLQNNISATVLKSHQDISGLQEKLEFATKAEATEAANELT